MKFNTKYDRQMRSKPEVFPEKSRVDLYNFVPKNKIIKSLVEAGKRLGPSGTFDIPSNGPEVDLDELECDPTRHPSFDMADASQMLRGLKDKAVADKIYRSKMKKGQIQGLDVESGQLTPEVSKDSVSVKTEKNKED